MDKYERLTFKQLKNELKNPQNSKETNTIIKHYMVIKYQKLLQKKQQKQSKIEILDDIIPPDSPEEFSKQSTRENTNNTIMDRLDNDIYINNIRPKKVSQIILPYSNTKDTTFASFDVYKEKNIKSFKNQ